MRFLDLFPPVPPGLDSRAAPNMGCAPGPGAGTKSTSKRSSLLLVLRVERAPYKAERVGEKPFFCVYLFVFLCKFPAFLQKGSGEGKRGWANTCNLRWGPFSVTKGNVFHKYGELPPPSPIALFLSLALSPLGSHDNLAKGTESMRHR